MCVFHKLFKHFALPNNLNRLCVIPLDLIKFITLFVVAAAEAAVSAVTVCRLGLCFLCMCVCLRSNKLLLVARPTNERRRKKSPTQTEF